MKIIKSLFVILTVAVIAGGATYSFFSDEEKSTGNTFSAGEINLKVDSEAHYNNLICAMNDENEYVWQDESECNETGDNLVQNGSFEVPEVTNPDHWQIFNSISPWVIEGMSDPGDVEGLEYHENGIYLGSTAADGDQYVELDGYYPVKLSQDIPATSDGKYLISFKYAPRPGHSENKLKVKFGESTILDITLPASGNFAWTSFSQMVAGPTTGTVKITFEETGANDQLGMFLDDVDIRKLECETVGTPELIGQECDGTWSLTDLQNGVHKFFNFSDIKPGDFGEDTISLHIAGNDAWGKMIVDVKEDSDGTCVDPEVEEEGSGCVEDGTNNGELRENLEFQVWLDQGTTPGFQGLEDKGEGDNIFNEHDVILITPGEINSDGEEWLVKDAILAAYAANGNAIAPGITADGHMTAGTTYYFGIGWELPVETGNEVQSDQFEADISFEVEQFRNNPSPF